VYAEYDTGRIWGLRAQDGKALANGELIVRNRESHPNVASFGEDSHGELYILAFEAGSTAWSTESEPGGTLSGGCRWSSKSTFARVLAIGSLKG
jgi:hypothetical protein